jgi:hypothetical protein
LAFVKHAGLGVGTPQFGQHFAFGLLAHIGVDGG